MDYFKIILFLLLVFFVIFNKENFVNPSLGDISMIEYQMPVNQFMNYDYDGGSNIDKIYDMYYEVDAKIDDYNYQIGEVQRNICSDNACVTCPVPDISGAEPLPKSCDGSFDSECVLQCKPGYIELNSSQSKGGKCVALESSPGKINRDGKYEGQSISCSSCSIYSEANLKLNNIINNYSKIQESIKQLSDDYQVAETNMFGLSNKIRNYETSFNDTKLPYCKISDKPSGKPVAPAERQEGFVVDAGDKWDQDNETVYIINNTGEILYVFFSHSNPNLDPPANSWEITPNNKKALSNPNKTALSNLKLFGPPSSATPKSATAGAAAYNKVIGEKKNPTQKDIDKAIKNREAAASETLSRDLVDGAKAANDVGSGVWQVLTLELGASAILKIPDFTDKQAWSIRPLKKNGKKEWCIFGNDEPPGNCGQPIIIEGGKGMVSDMSAVDGVNFKIKYQLTTSYQKERAAASPLFGTTVIDFNKNPCPENTKGCVNPMKLLGECAAEGGSDNAECRKIVFESDKRPNSSPCYHGTCNLKGIYKTWCDDIHSGQCSNSSDHWPRGLHTGEEYDRTKHGLNPGESSKCAPDNNYTTYCYDFDDANSSPVFGYPYKMKLIFTDL